MITSLVLSLREGLEAALIIGIVLGALHKTGRSDLNRPLWAGVISAFIVSLGVALLLRAMDKDLEGAAEQIFEGVTFLLAAGVLTWMIFWMRHQSRKMKLPDRLLTDLHWHSNFVGFSHRLGYGLFIGISNLFHFPSP
jgi:high-affinity iron transporter